MFSFLLGKYLGAEVLGQREVVLYVPLLWLLVEREAAER